MKKILHFLKNKRGPVTVLVLALIGMLTGYVMSHMSKLGLCLHPFYFIEYSDCGNSKIFQVGAPIGSLSLSLLTTSIMLFFAKKEVFKSWLWFGIPMGLFFVAWIFSLSVSPGYLSPRYTAADFFSILFPILSFVVIVYKSFKLQKKK